MNWSNELEKPMTMQVQVPSRDVLAGVIMAFQAGFVDTCGFIALFGLFTAHVTGNFVLIGATLSSQRPGIVGKLLAFPAFVLAVAGARAYILWSERRKRDATRPILLGQLLFLTSFLAAGVYATPILDADAPLTILVGMLGVAAMAIQNAAARTLFSGQAPTTVMTGNVTQVVMDVVDLGMGADVASARSRLRKISLPVFGFALGAVTSGIGFALTGFWSLLCPLLALSYVYLQYQGTSSPT